MNDLKKRMTDTIFQIREMQQIARCEWKTVEDDGEKIHSVLFEDVNGKQLKIPYHDPETRKMEYEADCVLLNILCSRIFKENDIDCPYSYPTTLKYVSGLVNDARKLFRMKNVGDLTAFKFQHCLPDERKEEYVDLSMCFYNNIFGCDDDFEKMLYFIERA